MQDLFCSTFGCRFKLQFIPAEKREREPFNRKFNKSLTSDNIKGTKEAAKKKQKQKVKLIGT